MLKPMNKNILSGLSLAALVLFASCSYSGQKTISVNGYTLITPSQERFEPSDERLSPIPSGMEGVDFAVEKLYLSKSKKSAFMISSALISVGDVGQDFAEEYLQTLKGQLEKSGAVELNVRDGNDGVKIASLAFAAGDVLTDKVLIYSLDKPNALMIDFIFSADEAESLKDDMAALLDSISVIE